MWPKSGQVSTKFDQHGATFWRLILGESLSGSVNFEELARLGQHHPGTAMSCPGQLRSPPGLPGKFVRGVWRATLR